MDPPTFSPTYIPTNTSDFNSSGDDDHESTTTRNEALIVASFSIVFYGILFLLSCYYYSKFYKIEKQKTNNINNPLSLSAGKYDHAKMLFFTCLMISSFLEIPTYIGCLAYDGPADCEWQAPENVIFWLFHLMALCGFACCIVIPCVLWSDMINKKDGKLFFSAFPYDPIKRYFQAIILLYFINTFLEICVTIAYYDNNNYLYYQETPSYSTSAVIECTLILLLSFGCLYCGIRLEVYVHEAKLNPTVEMKFLFTLNIILVVIVLSFVGRAVLVFQFAPGVPESYRRPVNYSVFTLITRWTPDVFCQYLLILIMRLSGDEVSAKNNLLSNTNNPMVVMRGRYSFFFPNSSSASRASSPKTVDSGTALQNPLLDRGDSMKEGARASEGYNEKGKRKDHVSKDLIKLEDNLLPVFKVADQFRHKMFSSTGSASEFRNEIFNSGAEEPHMTPINEAAWSPNEAISPSEIQFASTPSEQLSHFIQRFGYGNYGNPQASNNSAGMEFSQQHRNTQSSNNPLHSTEHSESYMVSSYGTAGQFLEAEDEAFSYSARRFLSVDSSKEVER